MKYSALAFVLRALARCYLWRYRPVIVAVTGSAGKTTTKDAIAAVLSGRYRVRASGGNLNNDVGTPTTIIGDFSDRYYRTGGTLSFWIGVMWRGCIGLLWQRAYPEILVLEFGADHPGDIKRLTGQYPPHIAVITHVGEIPVHVEFYASPQDIAREKQHIIGLLNQDDFAVLGADDLTVLEMREHTKGRVMTFGMGEGSDIRVTNVAPRLEGTRPLGIEFDIEAHGNVMPLIVDGVLGGGIARAAAAAVAVGSVMKIGLADAVQALSTLSVPAGRMRILDGIRNTIIIDDTYNASPSSVHLAIDTIRHLPATRHILVLGDMRELGTYSVRAHQALGTLAADVADVLICVGEQAKFIADAAGNQMPAEHIHRVANSRDAAQLVQKMLRAGDLVLVKGSQGIRMERIVEEIMARPEDAHRTLVRQSALWLAK